MGKYKLPLGFRFHPTDVELVKYYLKRKVLGKKFPFEAIAEIDIYKHAPWDLPDMSFLKTGDLKWFFFCPTGRKYGKGDRLNRATIDGYWKTTGKDRSVTYNEEVVGAIKTLVFHRGKAPNGERTDWVMHEYKLQEKELADKGVVQDAYVLCVVFNKDGWGPRNGAQYGAPFKEEDWSDDEDDNLIGPGSISVLSTPSFGGASSSHVPDSLCPAFIQSFGGASSSHVPNSLCPASIQFFGGGSSSHVHESLCPEPSIQSSGLFALPVVANPDAAVNYTTGIDGNALSMLVAPDANVALPFWVATDSNAALTGPAAPQVPGFANDKAVPALMEAPQLAEVPPIQEPNDDILSLLDIFTEDDAAPITYGNGQLTSNLNNFTFEAPQVSEDDDILSLLASFKEDDSWTWNNVLYPFQ